MNSKTITMLFFFLLVLVGCSDAKTETSGKIVSSNDLQQQQQQPDTTGLKIATFAGGCFWCTEGYFESLKGIKHVESGYIGGKKPNPTYEEVSRGNSGYAEAVQIYYDPNILTYQELLEVFFATHDPTTLNRQGPDVGEQYRSAVFFHSPEQKQQTEKYINQLNLKGAYQKKIVTTVEPFTTFWVAEEYHQDFYKRNPNNPYIRTVMQPKMKKLENNFKEKLK